MAHKLFLQFEDPVTIGFGPTPGNELRALNYVPSTTLRGAIFAGLKAEGLSDEVDAWLGPGGPRWSAAWPAGCVPMPRCFRKMKGDAGFRTPKGIWNTLSSAPVPRTAAEYRTLITDATETKLPENLAWQAVDKPFLDIGTNSTKAAEPASRIDMHAGLWYEQQTVRGSSLFSREALLPTRYWALVSEPPKQRDKLDFITLGKRKSVAGGAKLEWDEGAWNPRIHRLSPDGQGHQAVVQLLTDAIVPDSLGAYLRGLDKDAWSELLGVKVQNVRAASAAGYIAGWSALWEMPREQTPVIRSGSAWRLWSDDNALEARLAALEGKGIGIRRHEGFGWILVNPWWLTESLEHPWFRGQHEVDRELSEAEAAWPGFRRDEMDELRKLASGAKAAASSKWGAGHLAPLHDTIALVQRTQEVAQGLALLKSKRELRSVWKDLDDGLRGVLEDRSGASWALFYLEAVRTELEAKLEFEAGGRK